MTALSLLVRTVYQCGNSKIDQYLAKICTKVWWHVFTRYSCTG